MRLDGVRIVVYPDRRPQLIKPVEKSDKKKNSHEKKSETRHEWTA